MKEKMVLVLIPVDEEAKRTLEAAGPGCHFVYDDPEKVAKELVQEATVVVGAPPPHMLKEANNLVLLQLSRAGTGGYVEEGVLPKGVVLCNATGAYGVGIAEYLVGASLMMAKRLHLYRDNQAKELWKDEGDVLCLGESTTLVVGAGDIGTSFAERMQLLGSRTIGIKRVLDEKPACFEEMYTLDELDDVLPRADIVALCLPDTPKTRGLFNAARFEKMKKDAVLMNIGRGTAICADDLCAALKEGKLLGAVLDVTDPEPLPKGHPLWTMKEVLITPHVSGGFHIAHTLRTIVQIAADNIKAMLNSGEYRSVVDFETGYKKSNTR